MNLQIGRSNDHMKKPDGQIIYPSYFIHLLDNIDEISSFQFRQTHLNHILLLLKKNDQFGIPSISLLANLEKRIQVDLGWDVRIDIEDVSEIDIPPSGKHRYVVCEIEHGE